MNVIFNTSEMEELYLDDERDKDYPPGILDRYRAVVLQMFTAQNLNVLRQLKGLRIEKLHQGHYSARLNDQYRIIFDHDGKTLSIFLLELSKHYE